MIANITVNNYRSIRDDFKVSFVATKDDQNDPANVRVMEDGTRLLKTAIIYGTNTTGKSNITKAVSLLFHLMTVVPTDPKADLGARAFAFDQTTAGGLATTMSMEFYVNNVKHYMAITFKDNVIFDELLQVYSSSRPTTLYHRRYDSNSDSALVDFGPKAATGLSKKSQTHVVSNTRNNCSVLAVFGNSNLESCYLDEVYNYFLNYFTGLFTSVKDMIGYAKKLLLRDQSGKFKKFLIHMLGKVDFDITDLSVVEAGDASRLRFKYFRNALPLELTEDDEAKGLLRYLGMCATLYTQIDRPCLVILDGLDKELHHTKRSFFYQAFLHNTRRESQLLFTTHSFYLLDQDDLVRRDSIWITEFGDMRQTTIKRCSDLGIRKARTLTCAYDSGDIVELPIYGGHILELKELGFDDSEQVRETSDNEQNEKNP